MGKQIRLGELLVEKGLATAAQIDEAVRIQVGGNRRLGYILIKMGILSDDQLLEILSAQRDSPIIKIDAAISSEVTKVLPRYLCRKYSVIPIAKADNNVLELAMMDNSDDTAIADIENYTGMVVKPVLARATDISDAIGRHIPFSAKDLFNPHVFGRATKVFAAIALILLCVVGVIAYKYMQAEKFGSISLVGDSRTYKNHDLMLGVEKDGKVSLLGHGAYAKGYYSVTFNDIKTLQGFLEQKRKNFSDKQYDWLMWVIASQAQNPSGS